MTARPDDVERTHHLARAFPPAPSRGDRAHAVVGQVLLYAYIGFAIGVTLLWLVALAVLAWRVIYP